MLYTFVHAKLHYIRKPGWCSEAANCASSSDKDLISTFDAFPHDAFLFEM